MITRDKMSESLNRLGMLRHFPARQEVAAEVAKLLVHLCDTDEAACELVTGVLNRHSEWPGPLGLREVLDELKSEKAAAERKAADIEQLRLLRAERDTHEATCDGYRAYVDEKEQMVNIERCRHDFGEVSIRSGPCTQLIDVRCQRGESLGPEFDAERKCRLAEELAARPGYTEYSAGVVIERDQAARKAARAAGSVR